jgi:hypothetical protein
MYAHAGYLQIDLEAWIDCWALLADAHLEVAELVGDG